MKDYDHEKKDLSIACGLTIEEVGLFVKEIENKIKEMISEKEESISRLAEYLEKNIHGDAKKTRMICMLLAEHLGVFLHQLLRRENFEETMKI